jgi:type III secretion system FlhB-like substrate exporter
LKSKAKNQNNDKNKYLAMESAKADKKYTSEEVLLVEKNGHLELEQEVKQKIINAFKETPEKSEISENPDHEPRIFSARGKEEEIVREEEQVKKITAAVVKMIGEEQKSRCDFQCIQDEDSRTRGKLRNEVINKLQKEKPTLANAELLLVKGTEYAVGLIYSPGRIPYVAVTGKKKQAEKLIEEAFKLEIPVIEVTDWNTTRFSDIKPAQEIPDSLHPFAARALALIYRIQPGSHYVRFIKPKVKSTKNTRKSKKFVEKYADALSVDILSIEISPEIYSFRDELTKQLDMTINRLVSELGLIIPDVKVCQVSYLKGGEFILKIKGVTYDVGEMDTKLESPDIFYHLQSRFRALIHNFGYELLSFTDTQELVSNVKKHHPALCNSLFPHRFTIGALRYILKGLLKEYISIKDMVSILETIDGNIQNTNDPEQMVEYIRSALAQYISNRYKDGEGVINVIVLSQEAENKILGSIKEAMNVRWLDIDYNEGLSLLTSLSNELKTVEVLNIPVAILTSPAIRRFIRKITESSYPEIPVLSYSEIAPMTTVKTVGTINLKTT